MTTVKGHTHTHILGKKELKQREKSRKTGKGKERKTETRFRASKQ